MLQDVDLCLSKQAFVYPFQKVTKISITPFDFSMQIQAMTIEKLQFSLPAVFTIGPSDSQDALEKYAVLLTGESDGRPPAAASKGAITVAAGRNHVQEIVKGIIEGETRSIVSNSTSGSFRLNILSLHQELALTLHSDYGGAVP